MAKFLFVNVKKEESDRNYPKEWTDVIKTGHIKSAIAGGDDAAYERVGVQKVLIRLSDASGKLQFTKVAEGALNPKMLDQNDVFVIDTGREIFAWIGTKASAQRSVLRV